MRVTIYNSIGIKLKKKKPMTTEVRTVLIFWGEGSNQTIAGGDLGLGGIFNLGSTYRSAFTLRNSLSCTPMICAIFWVLLVFTSK